MMNRRAFLKAAACSAAALAVGAVSLAAARRLESWLPWTRMSALDRAGREWHGVARRCDARTWLASVDFRESAAIVGCRTPLGSYRWFSPIYVAGGDSIQFTYRTDIDFPAALPGHVPAEWRDLNDHGPRVSRGFDFERGELS